MPHLKIRGIEKKIIIDNSKEIIDNISRIVDCDRTWVTVEHQETEYIFDGKIVDGYTFIEVYWFARKDEVRKNLADYLTKLIKKLNDNKDCCVIFFPLTGDNYFDNGESFA